MASIGPNWQASTPTTGVDGPGCGSLEGSTGAVLQDGTMFLNSGYLFNQHMPGNVVLAFSVEENVAQQ